MCDQNSQMGTFGASFPIGKINKGFFTIINKETGDHRTFRIKKQAEGARFAPNAQIVGLLTGTDNESSYENFGFINPNGVGIWQKKKADRAFKAMGDLLHSLITQGEESPYAHRYTVKHSEKCFICGRTLTTPDSIETGLGPVCAGRI